MSHKNRAETLGSAVAQSTSETPKQGDDSDYNDKSYAIPGSSNPGVQCGHDTNLRPNTACPGQESTVLPHFDRNQTVTSSHAVPYAFPAQVLPPIPARQLTISPLFQDSDPGTLKPPFFNRHSEIPCSPQSLSSSPYRRIGSYSKWPSEPLRSSRDAPTNTHPEPPQQNGQPNLCSIPGVVPQGGSHSDSQKLHCEHNTHPSGLILPSIYLPPLSSYTFSEAPVLPSLSSTTLNPNHSPKRTERVDISIPSHFPGPLTLRETNLAKISDLEQACLYAFPGGDPQESQKPPRNLSHKTHNFAIENWGLFYGDARRTKSPPNNSSVAWKPGLSKSNDITAARDPGIMESGKAEGRYRFHDSPFSSSAIPGEPSPRIRSEPLTNELDFTPQPESSTAGHFKYPLSLMVRVRKMEHAIQNHPCNFASPIHTAKSAFLAYHDSLYHASYPTDWSIQQVVMASFGYPPEDSDADSHLHDAPGLAGENVEILSASLRGYLSCLRRAAECSVEEAHRLMKEHSVFRNVTRTEITSLYRHVVCGFNKARKHVVLKFGCYIRNRKWIENIATKQRRGCLTYRQKNVLRLWLFRNFTNPYPGVEDKDALVKQSGLSVTQVNNWLINARSRIWKPTVDVVSWNDPLRSTSLSKNTLGETDTFS